MSDELKPARFDERSEEGRAFAPRLPWKWIFALGLLVALGGGYYRWQQRSRAYQLRQTIAARWQAHAVPVKERVDAFRARIEPWVQQAAASAPETWADPRLNLAGLHRAQGVYLRIHESQAVDGDRISDAARTMRPDAIARCLGLSPTSLKSFYDRVPYVDPAWLQEVEEAGDDVLRLRVLDEQLKNRIERDLPLLLDATSSDYFLLVVQHGDSRREHPVDVYLWDLRRSQPLLRTRTRARGTLIPVRIALGDTPAGGAPPPPQRSGVVDCSIAAQVRAAAGERTPSVRSPMPLGELVEPPAEPATGADPAHEEGSTPARGEEPANETQVSGSEIAQPAAE